MNLQKMLNVFIIIFLLINGGLYMFIQNQDVKNHTLSSERVTQLQTILNKNNISIYDHLPEFYPKSRLILKKPEDTEPELVDFFFENDVYESDYFASPRKHESETQILTYDQSGEKGRVFYGSTKPSYVPELFIDSYRIKTAWQFVEDFTLGHGTYDLTDMRSGGENTYIYFFNEVFEDELLFCNEVVIKIDENGAADSKGITEARGIRYIPYGFEENRQEIYPIDEVLYKFMIYIRKEELGLSIITDIDIGYILGPDDLEDMLSVIVEPHYRIKLGSGQTYYINAYTNEIFQN